MIERCYDADHPVGFVQITPMTMGDLPMAHQIAALPELYAVCEEIAAEPYLDSDLASLLETLRVRAKSALRLANNPKNTRCPYGDLFCPCQDGDPCHYEGGDPMPPPNKPLKTGENEVTNDLDVAGSRG